VPEPIPSHLAWKRRIGRLSKRNGAREDRRVILIYHSVGPGPTALPVDAFVAQVNWLAANATVVSVNDLLKPSTPKGLCAAITFDDGYRSVRDHAAPILERAGFTASVYLSTSLIGNGRQGAPGAPAGIYPGEEFLSWDRVVPLREMGWVIGSHGTEHIDLTRQPQEIIRDNVTRSKATIEEQVGVQCRHFAYTWGRHNWQVREAVARAGYESAVAGVHGAVCTNSDRYALPRVDVRRDYQLEDFAALLRGDWDFLRYPQKLRQLLG